MERCSAALAALVLLLCILPRPARALEEAPVSRAGFVCLLWEGIGKPGTAAPFSFDDVARDAPCAEALGWGCEHDVLRGVGGGLFAPTAPLPGRRRPPSSDATQPRPAGIPSFLTG